MHLLKPDPGTYALILQCLTNEKIQVGHSRQMDVKPGYYIYVGSAFGPGGVIARVSRHCRQTKFRHWHIDYLREFVTPLTVWYSYHSEHLEHHWAQALLDLKDIQAVKGFGCTDCKCYSHLFWTDILSEVDRFSQILDRNIASESLII